MMPRHRVQVGPNLDWSVPAAGAAEPQIDPESKDEDLIQAGRDPHSNHPVPNTAIKEENMSEDDGASSSSVPLSLAVPKPEPSPPVPVSLFVSAHAQSFDEEEKFVPETTSSSPSPSLLSTNFRPDWVVPSPESAPVCSPIIKEESERPLKRRRDERPATSTSGEEEDGEERWHTKEEKDKPPDPMKFEPSREPGPTFDTSASWSPLALFQLFFSSSVVETIVANTNANVARRQQAGLKFVWKNLTVKDFYTFLAVIIFSGLVRVHDRCDYWRREWPYDFKFPSDAISRDHFEAILWMLHLSDPAKDEENDLKKKTAEYDRLFKIKPLYTDIMDACRVNFQPHRNLAIDARTVASKAHTSMDAKPAKAGYKLFVLSDSSTSYTWNFFVYEKKSADVSGKGLSLSAVTDLLSFPLLGRGYTLFMNSFCSSPALFEELLKNDTGACGTMIKSCDGFPKTRTNDLPENAVRGDLRWIRRSGLLFVKWMDAQEVAACSTVHEAFSGRTVERTVLDAGALQVKNVSVPDPVLDYSKNTSGVDHSDPLAGYQNMQHKTTKWYKMFFFHFLDIAVTNSYILHTELRDQQHDPSKKDGLTQKRFREVLVSQMMEFATADAPIKAPSSVCMPDFYVKSDARSRRFCVRCERSGLKRVRSAAYCVRCDVCLCLTPERNCFKEWHSQ